MRVHNLSHDVQTEAEPAVPASLPALPFERFKKLLPSVLRDGRTFVVHLENEPVLECLSPDGDRPTPVPILCI